MNGDEQSRGMAAIRIIRRICALAEFRDEQLSGHLSRMSRYSGELAKAAGIPNAHMIQLAAVAHDVGKVAIPDGIMFKPSPYTQSEHDVMKRHAAVGSSILDDHGMELLDLAAEIAGSHHEQWDGSGYPYGLAEEEIPISGRVASIADAWDAMTSDRSYRRALWLPDAITVIRSNAGRQFDPDLVPIFLRLIEQNKV